MSSFNQGLDIARNIKVVEWLKTELLGAVSACFKAMLKNSEVAIEDALASIIVTVYVLARRLGVSFNQLDITVESKVRTGIKERHEVEVWYGDLNALLKYLNEGKKR